MRCRLSSPLATLKTSLLLWKLHFEVWQMVVTASSQYGLPMVCWSRLPATVRSDKLYVYNADKSSHKGISLYARARGAIFKPQKG